MVKIPCKFDNEADLTMQDGWPQVLPDWWHLKGVMVQISKLGKPFVRNVQVEIPRYGQAVEHQQPRRVVIIQGYDADQGRFRLLVREPDTIHIRDFATVGLERITHDRALVVGPDEPTVRKRAGGASRVWRILTEEGDSNFRISQPPGSFLLGDTPARIAERSRKG